MKQTRSLVLAATVGLVAVLPAGAYAQSASTNLSVSANVAANCTISTTAVAFGTYDPLGTHAAANLDANGSVTVTCTKTSVPTITLGTGGNPAGALRQMSNGAGGLLPYQLYRANDYSTVWAGGTDAFVAPAAPSKAPRSFTVYGRVASGLDPAPGAYADTVLATVNF